MEIKFLSVFNAKTFRKMFYSVVSAVTEFIHESSAVALIFVDLRLQSCKQRHCQQFNLTRLIELGAICLMVILQFYDERKIIIKPTFSS